MKNIVAVTTTFTNGDVETQVFIADSEEFAIGEAFLNLNLNDRAISKIWCTWQNEEDLFNLLCDIQDSTNDQ